MLTGRQPEQVDARRALAQQGLDMLAARLDGSEFLVGEHPTIADVSNFAYVGVASDAGIDLERWPAVQAWLQHVRDLRRFVGGYIRYPANARPGQGRSIYDPS